MEMFKKEIYLHFNPLIINNTDRKQLPCPTMNDFLDSFWDKSGWTTWQCPLPNHTFHAMYDCIEATLYTVFY